MIINKNNFSEFNIIQPFLVKHISGEKRYAYAETDKGYLYINIFYPVIGCDSSPTYLLKKPNWRRVNNGLTINNDHDVMYGEDMKRFEELQREER